MKSIFISKFVRSKQSKFYFRNVLAHVLTQHDEMLLKILRQNDFQLDERYFDNPLKQAITRSLIKQIKQLSWTFKSLVLKCCEFKKMQITKKACRLALV